MNRVTPPVWSAEQERSNLFALRLMAWIAVHLGRQVARWLLHPITLYFLCFAPQSRRQSARYLARALGHRPSFRERYRHLHAFAAVVLDRVYFVRGRMENFELTLTGNGLVDDTLAAGRGAFLLGAHLGSFEALHAVGTERQLPVAMVMYPHNARTIHRVLQAIAPDFELGIIPIGSSGSTLAIRDHLDGGGLVGLLGDRLPPNENLRHAVIELPFLGRTARFSDGPLRLAMLLRRPVIFMCGVYHGGKRYDVRFELLADFRQPAADAAGRDLQLRQALQAYVARLEALCREVPYNWFNFYDFWREDPLG
jgi:hypothetical protein